jgi:hypothetical protein
MSDAPMMTDFDATMAVEGCWGMTDLEPGEENFEAACQHLINSGLAWQLQGSFGRTCAAMIDAGRCTHGGN